MKKMMGLLVLLGMVFQMMLPMNTAMAEDLTTIKLGAPEMDKGMSVIQALKERKSVRSFTDRQLTLQEVSNLLWAADGISREDGRRTAPSWANYQEFDIYVMRSDGVYVYEPKNQELIPVAAGDYQKYAGTQSYVTTASINLFFVADLDKIKAGADENAKLMIANMDVGYISENVALYSTSVGMASVPRAGMKKEELVQIFKLRPEQKIILAHSVGYPQ